jgi:hypothetical protein
MKKILLLAALGISSGALADSPPQNGQTAQPKKKGDGLICHIVEETGSRLGGSRVCMTREQWEENRTEARQSVERTQNSRAWTPSGN